MYQMINAIRQFFCLRLITSYIIVSVLIRDCNEPFDFGFLVFILNNNYILGFFSNKWEVVIVTC